MRVALSPWHDALRLSLGGIVVGLLAALAGNARADTPATVPVEGAVLPTGPLTLAACRQLALQQQPSIVGARASLAAASARSAALDNLRTPTCLAPDLPIRRKQAALGIVSAEAGVVRAEADTIYGVTFSYLSAVYAADQVRVADNAISNIEDFLKGVQVGLQTGAMRTLRAHDADKINTYLMLARSRREEAVEGLERARAALREAMGLPTDCPLLLADQELPNLNPVVDRQAIIAAALARRGEMVQAATAAEVTGYEVSAQHSRRLPNQRTFASGSDIHAHTVPPPLFDDQYRPGGLSLEMPTTMTGSRCDRVEQAQAYHARAEAVVVKTRNLIVLEANQAYYRWKEAREKRLRLVPALASARKLFHALQKNFADKVAGFTVDEWLSSGLLNTEMRVELNRAHYQSLIALASLERITAGAFCPFVPAAAAPAPEGEALPADVPDQAGGENARPNGQPSP
jgi:outer membrane protein TolC